MSAMRAHVRALIILIPFQRLACPEVVLIEIMCDALMLREEEYLRLYRVYSNCSFLERGAKIT
jgi:hypothetical protein